MFATILWLLSTIVMVGINLLGLASYSLWWAALPTVFFILYLNIRQGNDGYIDGLIDGFILWDIFDDWDD